MIPRTLAAVLAITILAIAGAQAAAQTAAVNADAQNQVRDATMRYYVALGSVMRGDLNPMDAVWSHHSEVSNLGPDGERTHGWNEVSKYFQSMARLNNAGKINPKDIVVVVSGTMAYSVCIENGQARMPQGPMVNYTQRATNIFRFEDGKWKLVHHHADPGAGSSTPTAR